MNNFVGTWKLLSFEEIQPDGSINRPYGEHPVGRLIYDAAGHMAVQIMRRDRQFLSSGDPQQAAPEEIKTAVEGFTAFFGTYEIDEAEQTVIHHVEGHLFPNSVGKYLKRRFEFSGDRLTLKPSDNRKLVWQRVAS
jgi:hypothetical protein